MQNCSSSFFSNVLTNDVVKEALLSWMSSRLYTSVFYLDAVLLGISTSSLALLPIDPTFRMSLFYVALKKPASFASRRSSIRYSLKKERREEGRKENQQQQQPQAGSCQIRAPGAVSQHDAILAP